MSRGILVINFNDALCGNSRESMHASAQRWGAELFEVNPSNDWKYPMAPNAYKTAVFERTAFDEVLILDADVVVSALCPNPFDMFAGPELIAVANGGPRFGDLSQIKSAEAYEVARLCSRDERFKQESYDPARYFNTGMMLVRRAFHKEMFTLALEVCHVDHGLGWCDQTPINMAARKLGVPVNLVHERWNYIHGSTLGDGWQTMRNKDVYIMHFAGECGREHVIPTINWR